MQDKPPVQENAQAGILAGLLVAVDQEMEELKASRERHAEALAALFDHSAHFQVREPRSGKIYDIKIERGSATDWDLESLAEVASEVQAATEIDIWQPRKPDMKAIKKIADERLKAMVMACARTRYSTKDGSRALATKVEVTAL